MSLHCLEVAWNLQQIISAVTFCRLAISIARSLRKVAESRDFVS